MLAYFFMDFLYKSQRAESDVWKAALDQRVPKIFFGMIPSENRSTSIIVGHKRRGKKQKYFNYDFMNLL